MKDFRAVYRRRVSDQVSFELLCVAAGLLCWQVLLPLVFLALRWWGV